MQLNTYKAMRVLLLASSLLGLQAASTTQDAAQACSKNTRQTVEACSCWIDLAEQRLSGEWFAIFLLEQTNPERAAKNADKWSTGAALNYADRVMTVTTNARRACRFNPFGL